MARRRKKKVYPGITITGIADKGKSVGRDAEGKVFFVDGPVPGDVVDVLVLRKKKGFLTGIVDNYVSYSDQRGRWQSVSTFGVCGGCKWQNFGYENQLAQKEQIVKDAVRKIGKLSPDLVLPIVGCEDIFYYRNKLEFSFSTKRWITDEEVRSGKEIEPKPAFGFHRPGVFDKIVDIYNCHLQEGFSDTLRNFIRDYAMKHSLSYYDIRGHNGLLRNCIVRNSTLGEWMVTMAFGEKNQEAIETIMETLKNEFPQITSLNYVINLKQNDTILDQNIINYAGKPFMVEALGMVKNIKLVRSPFFKQIASKQ